MEGYSRPAPPHSVAPQAQRQRSGTSSRICVWWFFSWVQFETSYELFHIKFLALLGSFVFRSFQWKALTLHLLRWYITALHMPHQTFLVLQTMYSNWQYVSNLTLAAKRLKNALSSLAMDIFYHKKRCTSICFEHFLSFLSIVFTVPLNTVIWQFFATFWDRYFAVKWYYKLLISSAKLLGSLQNKPATYI